MADNFVQIQTRTTTIDTTTTSVTLAGVVAGNALVAFLFDGTTSAPATHTVSDGQGSYTAQGPALADATNNVYGQAFVLTNANAGSHTVTGTVTTGNSCWIAVFEIGAGGGFSGANAAFLSGSTGLANDLSSGSVTVTGAATMVSMAVDTSSTAPTDEPNVGTSPFTFTSRQNNTVGVMGAYRCQTAAASASGAATAGSITTAHNYMTFGVAILNASSGPIQLDEDAEWIMISQAA